MFAVAEVGSPCCERCPNGSSKGSDLKIQRFLLLAALAFAAALIFGTLARVGMPYALYYKLAPWLGHPTMREYATIEHLLVFAAFGALLSSAYPSRLMFICCLLLMGAPLLEYLQTLTPDRHGTIRDACEKIAGGLVGAIEMHAAIRCHSMRRQ